MRRSLTAITIAVTLAGAATAAADKRPHVYPTPAAAQPDPHRDHGQPDRLSPAAVQRCVSRRNVLTQEENRADQYRSELAGIDAEIAQLEGRLDELRRNKAQSQRDLDAMQPRVSQIRAAYDRECRAGETCDTYDRQAAELDRQTTGIDAQLADIRDEIGQNRAAAASLEQRIAPLQREYAGRRCNDMVPGETEQLVIDRCMAVFTDWNRLQADLNRLNARIPDLQSRYQQLVAQLQGLEGRATGYAQYLERNCRTSTETAKMRAYVGHRQNAQGVGRDLDALVTQLTRLKGVKITVGVR